MKKFLFVIALVSGIAYHYDVLKSINPVYYEAQAVTSVLDVSGLNTAIDYSQFEAPVWWKK